MKILRSVLLYALATSVFPIAWLKEQRSALTFAWLGSFAIAHDRVKEIWRGDA